MPGDLAGFVIIAGCIGYLVIGGAWDYRNHCKHDGGALESLEIALWLAVLPCVAALAAMLYGNALLMLACLLAAIGAGLLWFVAYFFVLFA